MSNVPHELAEEFPASTEQLARLRQSDNHFAKLADDYHEINRAIHRAETDIEPTSDDHMISMRKQRILLKDEIAGYLNRVGAKVSSP